MEPKPCNHVYHRGLCFVSSKATMAKEKECLRFHYSYFKFTLGEVCMNHVTDFPHVVIANSESRE